MDAQTTSHLRELRDLLDGLLRRSGEGSGDAETSHWHLPVLPPPDPEGRLSSTDLLTWWFRAPAQASDADPWEAYFRPSDGDGDRTLPRPVPAGGPPGFPAAAAGLRHEPAPSEVSAHLGPLFPRPEEQLAEDHAQAAVEHLYELVHALGAGDVSAAMELIDDDYHVLEDDQEIDRERLRHRFESLLDSFRGWEIDVSLAEAPEPIQHPEGILITADLQLDAVRPDDGARRSLAERRVAWLRQDGAGDWKIVALSLVPS